MRLKIFVLSTIVAGIIGAAGLAAQAADMPLKAPRMPSAAYYNWTGFYIGANGGYGWGTSSWWDDPTLTGADFGSHTFNGGMVGGQIGYNYQISTFVLGIDADLDWADLNGSHTNPFGNLLNTKATSLGSVTGRLGYAMGQSLLFAKGGLAWGTFKYDNFLPGGTLNGNNSSTRTGWTIGGGYEYGFAANWSVKVEYDYMDFGRKRLAFTSGAGGAFVQDITDSIHVVKAGVNYRFNP